MRIRSHRSDAPQSRGARIDIAINALLACWALSAAALQIQAGDANPKEDQSLGKAYQRVVEMPVHEREHLQRNLEAFSKLTPDEQLKYRKLHEQLSRDENRGLSMLMQTYSAWLETLTPAQSEELRNEKDEAKRLALVRKFKHEQEYPPQPNDFSPEQPTMGQRLTLFRMQLPRDEFNILMRILITDLPERERQQFSSAKKAQEFVDAMKASIAATPDGPRGWPSPHMQEKLMAAITRKALKEQISSHPNQQRELLAVLFFQNIPSVALQEGSPLPSKFAIEKFMNSLSDREKAELAQMDPDHRKLEVRRRYFGERPESPFKSYDNIKGQINKWREAVIDPRTFRMPNRTENPTHPRSERSNSN